MTETTKKPTVKDSCLVDGRFDSLVSLRRELAAFQGELQKALEGKRKQFPRHETGFQSDLTRLLHRFFFLADYELITVLGGSIKDPKVQALIKKLFVNISAILPDDLGIIDLLYTTDGEDLPLCKSINTKISTVECWLAEMLEETKVALFASGQKQLQYHPIHSSIPINLT